MAVSLWGVQPASALNRSVDSTASFCIPLALYCIYSTGNVNVERQKVARAVEKFIEIRRVLRMVGVVPSSSNRKKHESLLDCRTGSN